MSGALMSSSPTSIQCPNANCLYASNSVGSQVCDRCHTPLQYVYVWAVGTRALEFEVGSQVGKRYIVVAPQIWLDTQPALQPFVPEPLPELALPYLHLVSNQLHVPSVYGFWQDKAGAVITLLNHAPINSQGQLFASLSHRWAIASPVRQLYWLWQLLNLWPDLSAEGVVTSLLMPDNIRIDGWRICLRELIADRKPSGQTSTPRLRELAALWQALSAQAHPSIQSVLTDLCHQLAEAEDSQRGWQAIATVLNRALLEQAAQLPLWLKIVGATTAGPQRSHNEDSCYPVTLGSRVSTHDPLIPNFGIICDGIGGHAGGEVASQLAVRSLQLQILALLTEVAEQPELTPPDIVAQQIEAIIRVVNNMIAEQNNAQGRESRQRMGTTMVMALQLPQNLTTEKGSGNTHELYIAHVGDSRAYWLTTSGCYLLTVDDDVATREVRMGHGLYWATRKRADAGALTQAVGTRSSDTLSPTVQRFIIEEEGILLLCSDGLSDGSRVEHHWEETTRKVLRGKLSLEQAVQFWLDLANSKNGHDNTSIVLMHCQISPSYVPLGDEPDLFTTTPPESAESGNESADGEPETELADSARALLYDDEFDAAATDPESDVVVKEPKPLSMWALTFGMAVLMFVIGVVGVAAWREINPDSFQRTVDRLVQMIHGSPSDRP